MIESIPITTKGPVEASAVWWSLSTQHRVTVIAKTTFRFDEHGGVRAVDATPLVREEVGPGGVPCDLAPFLRGVQVVLIGTARADATEVGLTIQRGTHVLLERRVRSDEVAALGRQPPSADEGLARFGASITSLAAGTDGATFSSAPPEQRLSNFDGGETIIIDGLDPRGARVVIPMPPFELSAEAKVGTLDVPFETRLDTVIVEPNSHRASLCWRGSFPVRADMLADLHLSVVLRLSGSASKTEARTTPMHAVAEQPLPFTPDADKTPPPLAGTLHGVAATGTVALRGRIPRSAATPFEPKTDAIHGAGTAALSREELKKAAAAAAIPFGSSTPRPAPQQNAAPIPDAPWASATKDTPTGGITPPQRGQSTVSIPFISRDAAPTDSATAEASPPQVEPEAPKEPAKKTAEEIERERPKQAWARGPETGPVEPTTSTKPKRAPRKALNDMLYGTSKPKKKK